MSSEIRIPDGDHRPRGSQGPREVARAAPRLASPAALAGQAGPSDHVSLSRLYHALKSAEMSVRLNSLQLQVANKSYLIPGAAISRSMIEEHLAGM